MYFIHLYIHFVIIDYFSYRIDVSVVLQKN